MAACTCKSRWKSWLRKRRSWHQTNTDWTSGYRKQTCRHQTSGRASCRRDASGLCRCDHPEHFEKRRPDYRRPSR